MLYFVLDSCNHFKRDQNVRIEILGKKMIATSISILLLNLIPDHASIVKKKGLRSCSRYPNALISASNT